MWASGPWTVFTCFRRELGSVYRLVQPGILHTYGFYRINVWLVSVWLMQKVKTPKNVKYESI